MRAVEFTIELKGESVVPIPAEVAAELPKTGIARIIILTGEQAEDAQWRCATYEQFVRDDALEDAVYDAHE